jgi:hypothetical protein
MERGKRSYENMKKRIDEGKPLNLNDQLNAISKGLLPAPVVGTPAVAMCKRSAKFAEGRTPNPAEYAHNFPTPQSRDFRSGQSQRIGREGKQNNLNDYVKYWPTPRNNSGPSKDKKHLSLDGAVQLFPTPTTQETEHPSMRLTHNGRRAGKGESHSLNLADTVQLLPTPTCPRPHDSENTVGKYMPNQKQKDLTTVAADGGQLSADWVEPLMGYPVGYTDIEVENENLFLPDFPTAWLDGSWEEGIPRIVTEQKNRIKRLKCLGNAVVPQIPMILWRLVEQHLAKTPKMYHNENEAKHD